MITISDIINQTKTPNSIRDENFEQPLADIKEGRYQHNLNQTGTINSKQMGYFEQSIPSVPEDSHQQQLKRLQHLRHACADEDFFKKAMYKKRSFTSYFSSSKYNFSYCKVHKAGGTFWTQVFTILRKGASEDVFRLARDELHRKFARSEKTTLKMATEQAPRTVLVSRNPYSRLFSAFIDKLFLPMYYSSAVAIVQRQRQSNDSCANDITFEEFLTDIIDNVRKGHKLDVHWTPIVNLCKPCSVHAFALIKQETFTTDVEYVLKEVGIASDEFEVIYKALHDNKIETTMHGIVATAITKWKRNVVQKCMNSLELARRLWTAFQFQGYIKDDLPFPSNIIKTNGKAASLDFLMKVMLETIKKHPLSHNESKLQRQRALVKAFQGMSQDILDQIKEVYKQDFILFDYAFETPSMKQ